MSKRVGPEVCTAGRMFARLRWLALFTSGLALGGCLKPTPFGSDTDEHQLNRSAMENLQTPRSTERVRFVALGDTHDAYDELWEATAAINRAPGVDFVLHTGDVTDFGLAQEFEWTARALSGVRFRALVVIGNHDAISNGKAVYRELYGPFDFSFSYGGYKFVLFNSNALEFEGAAPDRAWLESELSDLHGADAVVLVTPPKSPGSGRAVRLRRLSVLRAAAAPLSDRPHRSRSPRGARARDLASGSPTPARHVQQDPRLLGRHPVREPGRSRNV